MTRPTCRPCGVRMTRVVRPHERLRATKEFYATYRCPRCGQRVADVVKGTQRYARLLEPIRAEKEK